MTEDRDYSTVDEDAGSVHVIKAVGFNPDHMYSIEWGNRDDGEPEHTVIGLASAIAELYAVLLPTKLSGGITHLVARGITGNSVWPDTVRRKLGLQA